jgi:hypothetical protein
MMSMNNYYNSNPNILNMNNTMNNTPMSNYTGNFQSNITSSHVFINSTRKDYHMNEYGCNYEFIQEYSCEPPPASLPSSSVGARSPYSLRSYPKKLSSTTITTTTSTTTTTSPSSSSSSSSSSSATSNFSYNNNDLTNQYCQFKKNISMILNGDFDPKVVESNFSYNRDYIQHSYFRHDLTPNDLVLALDHNLSYHISIRISQLQQ